MLQISKYNLIFFKEPGVDAVLSSLWRVVEYFRHERVKEVTIYPALSQYTFKPKRSITCCVTLTLSLANLWRHWALI